MYVLIFKNWDFGINILLLVLLVLAHKNYGFCSLFDISSTWSSRGCIRSFLDSVAHVMKN